METTGVEYSMQCAVFVGYFFLISDCVSSQCCWAVGSAAVRFYFRCVVDAGGRASDCRRAMGTVIYSGVKIMQLAPLPALDPS